MTTINPSNSNISSKLVDELTATVKKTINKESLTQQSSWQGTSMSAAKQNNTLANKLLSQQNIGLINSIKSSFSDTKSSTQSNTDQKSFIDNIISQIQEFGRNNRTPPPATATATATAQFVSETSDKKNVLFTYDLDDSGNISNIRQLIENSNDRLRENQILGEVSMKNGKPNLLLLPNGVDKLAGNQQLKMINNELHIVDGQTTRAYGGIAYFSSDVTAGGLSPFQTVTDNNGNMTIKIEDNLQTTTDLTKNKYDDLTIKVSTQALFEQYVSDSKDLETAWNDMKQFGIVQSNMKGEYFSETGQGISEQHFINGWNAVSGRRDIQDLGDLTKAEWGMLHYEMHGNQGNRTLPGKAPDLPQSPYEQYVSKYQDLKTAWESMSAPEKVKDEQHWIDLWNNATDGKKINDLEELTKAEWGKLHYETYGKNEQRTLPGQPPAQSNNNNSNPTNNNSNKMTFHEAAKIIKENFNTVDNAAGIGNRDGIVSKSDLQAIANSTSPGLSPELKKAAAQLLKSPAVFQQIDVASQGGGQDTYIGKEDLVAFLKTKKISDATVTPTNKKEAAKIILENFDLFDTATAKTSKDGLIGQGDLHIIKTDSSLPEAIRKAAEILSDDKTFKQIDNIRGDKKDKLISAGDLDTFLKVNNSDTMTFTKAAFIIKANFDTVDIASGGGGGLDGKVSKSDLKAIKDDPFSDQELKDAAKLLYESTAVFNQIDVASLGGKQDTLIGENDLAKFMSINKIEKTTTTKPKNPKEAAKIILENFDLFDTATAKTSKDGLIGQGDLSIISNDMTLPEAIREAAKILLKSSVSFSQIDAATTNVTDGLIGITDLQAYLRS